MNLSTTVNGRAERNLFPAIARRERLKCVDAAGPRKLGEWRVVRELDRGGMGVVYEATRPSDGATAAIKVIESNAAFGPSDRDRRFRREARLGGRLSHPHIVPVLEASECGGWAYIVMPLIDGENLEAVIRALKDRAPRPRARDVAVGLAKNGFGRFARRCAEIGVCLAEALEFAHGEGVLHRDVKPSNVLLEPGGHVWLADFGVARSRQCDRLSRTGDMVGTLCYMAPEQLAGEAEARSDVYSLALTLAELVTRSHAFGGDDPLRVVYRIARGEAFDLRKAEPRTPDGLAAILAKASRPEAGERYASASEFAADLRRFVRGEPVEAGRHSRAARLWGWLNGHRPAGNSHRSRPR